MTSDQEAMLDDLLQFESGLRGADMDFLESLDEAWRERDLSKKQAKWLENLVDRNL